MLFHAGSFHSIEFTSIANPVVESMRMLLFSGQLELRQQPTSWQRLTGCRYKFCYLHPINTDGHHMAVASYPYQNAGSFELKFQLIINSEQLRVDAPLVQSKRQRRRRCVSAWYLQSSLPSKRMLFFVEVLISKLYATNNLFSQICLMILKSRLSKLLMEKNSVQGGKVIRLILSRR